MKTIFLVPECLEESDFITARADGISVPSPTALATAIRSSSLALHPANNNLPCQVCDPNDPANDNSTISCYISPIQRKRSLFLFAADHTTRRTPFRTTCAPIEMKRSEPDARRASMTAERTVGAGRGRADEVVRSPGSSPFEHSQHTNYLSARVLHQPKN